ncbi:hypothetical protein [Actinomadura sp. 3N407]|uniref:hypothetical protein n=1 Tax=Actinomadura sp. 3N407 TaxID=3457423 RepID=UPI003FCCB94D
MGMPGYEVDPELIRSAGAGMSTAAQRLAADWQAFQQELAGFGEPWGQDDIGFLIGGCYQAVYQVAVECYEDNLTALDGQAQAMKFVAANHVAGEQSNVVEINRVRDVLG